MEKEEENKKVQLSKEQFDKMIDKALKFNPNKDMREPIQYNNPNTNLKKT
ncbi:hypothetical protein FACS1894181_17330 [Bacteroidia bacterium]|nr:hypothetical protein FACS1894181_17330 [Bacteroidia bacterium]